MATFQYTTPGGGVATIEANDRAMAVREVLRRGQSPNSVTELAAGEQAGARKSAMSVFRGAAMGRAETASFIRELATAIEAGLPLVQALRTLGKQGRSTRQQEMLNFLIEQVEHGKTLSDAMSAWGPPFGDLTINMTRAGEVSGQMGEVLGQAADLLDKDLKLRRSLIGAITYPAALLVLVSGAIIIVVTVIVPKLPKQFASLGSRLPWPTRVLQGTADFFASYWWLVLLVLAGIFIFVSRTYASREGRLKIDRGLLKVPVLGTMLRDVAVARFTRTLGTLTSSGIPVIMALKVTKGTLGNRAMENVIETVIEKVSTGQTLAEPMEKSGYFPPMLVQIVNLGERSGRLDHMLKNAAKAFEERTEISVKVFTTILPPILVVFMAGIIGFVVLAIMLAFLEFQDSIGSL